MLTLPSGFQRLQDAPHTILHESLAIELSGRCYLTFLLRPPCLRFADRVGYLHADSDFVDLKRH